MSATIDPSKLKVVELRNELQERGLDTKGNKAALVERLKQALEKETNTKLPDTSIMETSTEDCDTSQNEEESEDKDETKNEDEDEKEEHSEKPTTQSTDESIAKSEEKTTSSEVKTPAENGETESGQKENESKESKEEQMDESTEAKGEKRKRSTDSPDRKAAQKPRTKSPVKEDEPVINTDNVQLNWYDSDLHLQLDKENFLSGKPFHEGAFGYAWAGVRASHGISEGKVYYEVKITEKFDRETFAASDRRYSRILKKDKRMRKKDYKNDKAAEDKTKSDDKTKTDEKDKEGSEDKKDETSENGVDVKTEPTGETTVNAEATDDAEKMDTSESEKKTEEAPMETEAAADIKKETNEESQDGDEKKEDEKKEEEKKDDEKTEDAEDEKAAPEETLATNLIRIGWSLVTSSLQLGEEKFSYAYESTGKFVTDKQFVEYAKPFAVGDVVGAYLSIDEEYVTMRYTVNGEIQPVAATIQKSEFPQENFALFPHILTLNYAFEVNLGQKEEPWFASPELLQDYTFLGKIEDRISGPLRPETRGDCEVILMCGLPGSGKTHWVKEHISTNAEKRYTVIGNSSLLERMTVDGNSLRSKYKNKWSGFVDKLQKCLNILITLASRRRRNYIIDQTNVFPSAQRRKMQPFEGFKRKAVIVVVGDEEQTKRQAAQESIDGKGVPESVILEMKAAMTLPEKGDWMDEVIYAGLDEEATKSQVKSYNEVGKAAGYGTEKRFRGDRSHGRRGNDFRGKGGRGRSFRDNRRFDARGGRRGGPRGGSSWRDRIDRRPPPPRREFRGGRDFDRDYGRDFGRRDGGGFNRNRNSGGDRWSSGGGRSGGWSSGGGGGGWNQQAFGGGGYGGNWGNQGASPWKYGGGGGGGQQGYGGGYGGNQGQGGYNNYYGQYSQHQNWRK